MKTFYIQDYRTYSVGAKTPTGKVVVKDASHPTSVTVNQEFSWYVVGHVQDATVRNAGVGYYYKDGPASRVKIIDNAGNEHDLPRGYALVLYIKGDSGVCTEIDSRRALRGAKFPTAGTYTIWLISGYFSETQAMMGSPTYGGMYMLKTRDISTFLGIPFTVQVPPVEEVIPYILAGLPAIIIGGIVVASVLSKRR